MIIKDQVYKDVYKNLKSKYEKDMNFQNEMLKLLHFYGRKIMIHLKQDKHKEYIETQLENLINSQFFQGYYTMTNILYDEETKLPENIWNLYPGIIRNEIPILLDSIFENDENWYVTDVSHNIGMRIIQMFEGAYELLKQMRKDVTYYAAYKAFIDDKRYQQPTNSDELLWGNPFDLTFVNPQVYMRPQFVTEQNEIWDIYTWSTFKGGGSWIGTIQLSTIPNDGINFYLLQFTISETIVEQEKYEILEYLLNKLPDTIRAVLQIRMIHMREIEIVEPLQHSSGTL